jgi:hypothetical protein
MDLSPKFWVNFSVDDDTISLCISFATSVEVSPVKLASTDPVAGPYEASRPMESDFSNLSASVDVVPCDAVFVDPTSKMSWVVEPTS